MVAVCLNMIVKNEALIIERSLAAAAPFIDYYVICDTGSTDGTQALIRETMRRHGIPGEIHQTEFRDFSQARNRALDVARASRAAFDYILLLDADMELAIGDSTVKQRLVEPVYVIRQEGSLSYYNVRLVRREVDARYIGVTHEYVQHAGRATRLEELWFVDHADGANRVEKFERDIRLLTEDLKRDPDNVRTLFYLAQSYKDVGDYDRAISYYQRRIDAGGWDEEVWYARYMIALCYRFMGNEAEFIRHSWIAYSARPSRSEPLYHLAVHFREKGLHDACLAICELGRTIPYPADSLFVERDVYRAGFQREMSISGFYCALPLRKAAGRDAVVTLTTDRDESPEWRWRSLNNATYYLRTARELFPSFRHQSIEVATEPGFTPLNPSIAVHAGRRFCVVRTSNFGEDGWPRPASGLDVVATRNMVVEFDADYRQTAVTAVDESRDPGPVYPSIITGFEDCRLFWHRGKPWFSCTVIDRNMDVRCEIALLELNEQWQLERVHIQQSPEPYLHQKNWMPFVRDGELHFIYKLEPLTILRVDDATVQPVLIANEQSSEALGLFRGGSQLLPIDGGWLGVAHEVAQPNPPTRTYLHRVLRFDADLRLIGLTEPFSFHGRNIEYCAGLARDPMTGQLVVSYGVMDAEAHLGFIDEAEVMAAIRPARGAELMR